MTHGALSGRTALVTGAAAGIGAAAACALSRAGASVVLAARDGRALATLAADIGSAGGHAIAVPADLGNPVSVRRLIEQTLGAFGRLDAAVNNAAPRGVSLAMRYQIPSMRRAGGGRIVNLAPSADVIELTRVAALTVASSGVRIHAVATGSPGGVEDLATAIVLLCGGSVP